MNNRQAGKITLVNLVMSVLLCYGAFAAFKYLQAGTTKKQIGKEIYDVVGIVRGSDMTQPRAEKAILEILEKHEVNPGSESVSVTVAGSQLNIEVDYALTVNYLIFKRTEQVHYSRSMDNYGG